jgi:arylsulfatase B
MSIPLRRREFLAALAAPLAPCPKPNIVLILADDLGYGELGCQGNRQIPTPNIDSIAANGVRFTNGYVTAPYCSPSRAGLMTGRYQTRFGHELNATGKQNLLPNVGLPESETTLGARLKAAGYRTAIIGKWHLGGTAKYHPLNRGFDEFFGFLHEGHFYVPPPFKGAGSHLRPNEPPYDENNPLLRGFQPVTEPEYLTRAFGREAAAFIRRNRSRPFFLYLPFNAIHSPMQALTDDIDRFDHIRDRHRRVFAGMESSMDEAVGVVLEELRRNQLTENTLLFFLSDNGGPTAELTSSNLPLRGGKGQLYEGGIRIPFMLQWPARLGEHGKVFDQPVISLDIAATCVAAARERANLDGVDLLPYLAAQGSGNPHQVLFWRHGRAWAIRKGNWKLVVQGSRGQPNPAPQLFDLASGISETNDLASTNPDIVRELKSAWEAMNREMVPPRWGA